MPLEHTFKTLAKPPKVLVSKPLNPPQRHRLGSRSMIEGFKWGLNPGLITRVCLQSRTPHHMTRHQNAGTYECASLKDIWTLIRRDSLAKGGAQTNKRLHLPTRVIPDSQQKKGRLDLAACIHLVLTSTDASFTTIWNITQKIWTHFHKKKKKEHSKIHLLDTTQFLRVEEGKLLCYQCCS